MLKKLQVCGRFYSFMREDRDNGNPEKLIKESLKSERIQNKKKRTKNKVMEL